MTRGATLANVDRRRIASVALVALVALAGGLFAGDWHGRRHAVREPARPVEVAVDVAVSAWPASGAAGWTDAYGHDVAVPLGTFGTRGPLVAAWVTVNDPGVSCTLTVNRVVVASETASDGQPAHCRWPNP